MDNTGEKLWTWSFINAFIAHFLMGFSFYLLIPTLPFYIVEKFQAPKSVIGLILSCYIIAALAVRPFSGYLLDRFSRKQIYLLSYIIFVIFYGGYIIAGSLILLVFYRIMQGFTWGTITTAGNTLAIDIMPANKRGEGIGYYGMAMNLSLAVGPMVGLFMYENYPFEYIFYAALASSTIGLIAAALIKAPSKMHIHHKQPLSLDRFILLKGLVISLNVILIAIPYGIVLTFSAMYGKELHVTNTGLFFTFMALGITLSRISSGRMIDRGKIHQVSVTGLSTLVLSFTMFTLSNTPALFYTSALFIGIGYGILFPAFQYLFINIATHHQRGTANSTFFTAFDIGVGGGMIIGGKIAEKNSLSIAFGLSVILVTLAVLFYLKISKENFNRNKIELVN